MTITVVKVWRWRQQCNTLIDPHQEIIGQPNGYQALLGGLYPWQGSEGCANACGALALREICGF